MREIEAYVPVCNKIKEQNAHWRLCKQRREPYLMVNNSDSGWRVTHDHGTIPYRLGSASDNGWLTDNAGRLAARFLAGLLNMGRISSAGPPPGEHVFVHGVRLREEAQMIGTLLGECFMGNHDGISRAICVLEGHQDPCEQGLLPKQFLANAPVPAYPWMPDI